MYFVTYLLAPKYCHSFVGYLEVGNHITALCRDPGTDFSANACAASPACRGAALSAVSPASLPSSSGRPSDLAISSGTAAAAGPQHTVRDEPSCPPPDGLSVYTQEEAVKTYTRALEDLDAGKLPQWSTQPVSHVL